MKYGYARVSSPEQNVNHQSLQMIEHSNLYQEVWTGKTIERPTLVHKMLKPEPGDALYVFHINRLGRKKLVRV